MQVLNKNLQTRFSFKPNQISKKLAKSPRGVGFFFMLASTQKGGKKPHPPWGFCRKTPVVI